MLCVDNLSFGYAHRSPDRPQTLQDVQLEVASGGFWGIVGPNGSGKTTLLNLVTGQLHPTGGRVLLKGRPIGEYPLDELARLAAVVPQNLDIRFPFTCLDIVLMGRIPHKSRLAGYSDQDLEQAHQAMEWTETLNFAGRLITELSGGERQRVIFAKALAQQPEILFLDEAFSNMDVYYSIRCLDLLGRLCRERRLTVVSIMHDLNLTSAFCSDVAVLQAGQLVSAGPAAAILTPERIRDVFRIHVVRAGERGLAILPEC
ncbi:MAG TPA: ABC transporter ATP-binding protein [Patescibacteria group bacterium]|nr:ABC transporter ATP-binding protein [Patescibacteria group bacterium]